METYDDSNDLWFYFADFLKESKFSQLRNCHSFSGIGNQHFLYDLNSFDTDVIRNVVKTFDDSFVQILGIIFLKR